MNAPVLHDASGLAETVSRARALLDDGDVINAKLLASGAYDQAKGAGNYATRIGAGEKLIGKARQLQGDALLIESRAKIRIAEEWDAAQAAGLASTGGRPKTLPDGNGFTAEQAGLSAKDIHEARKLAAAEREKPGIVARAIAARIAAGLEPSRANLRAAVGTDSASRQERGNNFYETPIEAMRALLALERFAPHVLEPACGRGAILRPLEDAGYDVTISDLVDYGTATRDGECQGVGDFLTTSSGRRVPGVSDTDPAFSPDASATGARGGSGSKPPRREVVSPAAYDIVTNPPYGEVLNGFVAHALRVHRPRKMALLLNLNFLAGFDDPDRCFAMDECKPSRVHVFTRRLPMMHRDGWTGPEASSRMNAAWFVWELERGAYRGPTILNRVDWMNYAETAPKKPLRLGGPGNRMVSSQ